MRSHAFGGGRTPIFSTTRERVCVCARARVCVNKTEQMLRNRVGCASTMHTAHPSNAHGLVHGRRPAENPLPLPSDSSVCYLAVGGKKARCECARARVPPPTHTHTPPRTPSLSHINQVKWYAFGHKVIASTALGSLSRRYSQSRRCTAAARSISLTQRLS